MKQLIQVDLQNRVHRRYMVELGIAMVLYVAVLWISPALEARIGPGPWLYVAALLPMVPIAIAIVAVLRYLFDCDEFERQITICSLAITMCATAFATLACGFLEGAGLPRLSMFCVWPFMAACWIVSTFALRLRYR